MEADLTCGMKAVGPAQVVDVDVLEADLFAQVVPGLLQVEAMCEFRRHNNE